MKKCPVCEKTFEDSMRFCQTDGTPLDDIIEAAPDDPYKTMVGRPDDIFPAPPLPPDDPFKTMVAGSKPKDDSGDLLQLPEEFDSMKTAVVSPEEMQEHLSAGISQENASEPIEPPSPFAETDSPLELSPDESSNVSSSTPTDIPRFNEPSLNPPDFGDMPSPSDSSENVTEIIPPESMPPGNPFSFDSNPVPPQSSAPPNQFGDSPFNTPNDAPIPSPFDDAPKSYEQPSTPMPPYKEPEPPTILGSNPFDQPPVFGQQDPLNQPFNPSAPQTDWSPPPAPVSNWQDQGLGANTPFQPPPATAQGQNQILPIVSLILGIVSICCPIGILTGPGAIITGFLGIKNINADPAQYGGKGIAIAGMIVGGFFFLLSIIWWILRLLGLAYWSMGGY